MAANDIRDVGQNRLTFRRDSTFHKELRRRVDDYFRSSNRSQRDCLAMYLKTAIILVVFSGFYSLLVFVAGSWWQALPLAVLLGLAMAAIGAIAGNASAIATRNAIRDLRRCIRAGSSHKKTRLFLGARSYARAERASIGTAAA